MRVYQATMFHQAYAKLLADLVHDPQAIPSPRGEGTREIGPACIHLPRVEPDDQGIFVNEVRSTNLRYLAAELMLYLRGENRADEFGRFATMWKKVCNPDGTINSAYGHSIFVKRNAAGFTEWEWVRDCLRRDQDTRQAIAVLHGIEHHVPGTKDVPCTLNIGFRIRDRQLHTHVNMRSSDVHFGLPYDVPFFMLLQRLLARDQDVMPGQFTLITMSAHVYDTQTARIRGMIGHRFENHAPIVDPTSDVLDPKNLTETNPDEFVQWLYEQMHKPLVSA